MIVFVQDIERHGRCTGFLIEVAGLLGRGRHGFFDEHMLGVFNGYARGDNFGSRRRLLASYDRNDIARLYTLVACIHQLAVPQHFATCGGPWA